MIITSSVSASCDVASVCVASASVILLQHHRLDDLVGLRGLVVEARKGRTMSGVRIAWRAISPQLDLIDPPQTNFRMQGRSIQKTSAGNIDAGTKGRQWQDRARVREDGSGECECRGRAATQRTARQTGQCSAKRKEGGTKVRFLQEIARVIPDAPRPGA